MVVKLVVKPKPTNQVNVMARAEPLARTLARNISPTIALGMVPKPGKEEENIINYGQKSQKGFRHR